MSKKRALLAGLGFLAAVAVASGIKIIGDRDEGMIEPGGELLPTKRIVERKEEIYEDESGFSFKLPADLAIEDKTEQAGDEYYTLLEIKSEKDNKGDKGKMGGSVKIVIKDTKYNTVEDWLEQDEEAPKGAKLAGAVALDKIEAKQYAREDKIWTAAVDLGALYLIEGKKDGGYWQDMYDRLIETFAFAEPEPESERKVVGSSNGGAAVGGDVVYEAEEVVE